jgi:hypothetical protein
VQIVVQAKIQEKPNTDLINLIKMSFDTLAEDSKSYGMEKKISYTYGFSKT